MDPVVALDTETEFTKTLSVGVQGNRVYGAKAKWFLVSLYSSELGIEYVGPPEEAPWEEVNDQIWISHNAGFDQSVFFAGRDRGQVGRSIVPRAWCCSADLAAYCLLGRSLTEAVRNAFGVEVPKTVRDSSIGKIWPDSFSPEQQEEFRHYCLSDARWCHQLWQRYAGDWPPAEREFADLIRRRANNGVMIDQPALTQALIRLQEIKDTAEDQIPWA